ncbi:MAG: SAM-dependent methyltransferase [Chloroflexi bacterium]|nr:SAM-dependent methyltransferase [Chloroflexota bacterium]MCI0579044.1 SAM-dependent methyltransferase [Chloroflexota bacterium]MCI0644622.1 SAM-dependent methyltransferase [Chloroflexota bacterium]MCI0727627.1 SAM-dependent methyltransferase [Chloroflexota bacterium]
MTTTVPSSVDTSIPNAARIYDYTLGGTANYEVDRQAAEFMFQLIPSTKKWVRMLRAFLQEAAQTLHEEGFTQFLDLASGLPTEDHIHSVLPTSVSIVYNDIDPVTVRHAETLLQNVSNVKYNLTDVRNIEEILASDVVRQMIDPSRKVAIGFNGISVFLSREENHHIAQTLYDWAPSGSKLYVTYETKAAGKTTPAFDQFLGMFTATGSPMHLYSLEENVEMMKPWETERLEPVSKFLGLPDDFVTEADREGVDLEFYAAILVK